MLRLPRKLLKTTQKYCACHINRPSTRYQTGWNATKCRACHAKRQDNLLGNLQNAATATKTATHLVKTSQKYCAFHTKRFSTRYKKNTSEVPHLPRKTKWQPAWKPSKRRGFAASPTDTARPQENQRLETRHVGAAKRAFRARLPLILTLCSFKIDVFLRVFLGTSKFATSKTMYRARLPSIFSISHKMPRLPRNLHLVCRHLTQPCQCDSQKHATCCACYAKWQSAAPATKLQRCKSIAPATQNDFRHVTKHVWMSRRATPATRNEATPQAYETSKNDPFCRTSHRHGHMAMTRTVANGCGRLSNVEGTYPQPPDPQSETGTLATHSGKSSSGVLCAKAFVWKGASA